MRECESERGLGGKGRGKGSCTMRSEHIYKDRVKEWEAREREKEYQRQKEREREKEYQRERRREILKDENESDDDDTWKRRGGNSTYEERTRKRQREKEEDLADRLKVEDEIAEAKGRAIETQLSEDDLKPLSLKPLSSQVSNESGKPVIQEAELHVEGVENAPDHVCESVPASGNNMGDGNYINNSSDELTMGPAAVSTIKQNSNAPSRKLGFGLVGSGKRTAVPSVFNEEDDEDADEKKMRPLVPIDYSTEELQAVQPSASKPSSNPVAAAEFAKRVSTVNPKEDKPGLERERNGQSIERLSQKEQDRNDEQSTHARNENKLRIQDKIFDREEKPKTNNKKLSDAKQLIDMIPKAKTKEELFAYEINWATYDKYELHERMRPWISKKITKFLGEEEPILVDHIVSSTKDHVQASKMLELLQSILDDEAEMLVLKMWRMLIFEIKKVEAGLSGKSRG